MSSTESLKNNKSYDSVARLPSPQSIERIRRIHKEEQKKATAARERNEERRRRKKEKKRRSKHKSKDKSKQRPDTNARSSLSRGLTTYDGTVTDRSQRSSQSLSDGVSSSSSSLWDDDNNITSYDAAEAETAFMNKKFAGQRSLTEMKRILNPTQFMIYYRTDVKSRIPGEIPFQLPLCLAYKDGGNKMYSFPVQTFEETGFRCRETKWVVKLPGKCSSASFTSLQKLLEYYEIYSFVNPNNGTVEVFPVWLAQAE
ncbi:unnamed protein product [Bursaphelenchus okinawaensis]|uniref:Uncharacterized protein n=1 Tax=Bursaphelenchus okinawaensis TaxID=465554 RepID=A0A811KDL1_9BILA|nr:unnamed protein product [Bursaphelenchus okinawaensis]CAG9101736.1 unnamed protein product [Bursaphelenchus okinawaensis]